MVALLQKKTLDNVKNLLRKRRKTMKNERLPLKSDNKRRDKKSPNVIIQNLQNQGYYNFIRLLVNFIILHIIIIFTLSNIFHYSITYLFVLKMKAKKSAVGFFSNL